MTETTETRFKSGDHVKIVGVHPWRGHSGVISGPFEGSGPHGIDWIVELDDAPMSAGAAEKNLRREGDQQ